MLEEEEIIIIGEEEETKVVDIVLIITTANCNVKSVSGLVIWLSNATTGLIQPFKLLPAVTKIDNNHHFYAMMAITKTLTDPG